MVERFRSDFAGLIAQDVGIGIAVSGGPDSLALLLLAAAAFPNNVEAATVDHGLRAESRQEAKLVSEICQALGIPHSVLQVDWESIPKSNLQAEAREQRYALLGAWACRSGLGAISTAHHADDQAETLLMRLARGSGVAGLGGVRLARPLDQNIHLIRPLLGWRRAELHAIVADAGLIAVNDPSNRDARFDRTAARDLLASVDWLDSARLAASANHCRDAEDALDWSALREWDARSERDADAVLLRVQGLPRELKRRLLVMAVRLVASRKPPGPDLMSCLDRLEAGEVTTLAGLKLEGGPQWRIAPAPPRTTKAGL